MNLAHFLECNVRLGEALRMSGPRRLMPWNVPWPGTPVQAGISPLVVFILS